VSKLSINYEEILSRVHGSFKHLNAELNPICHLLALLGAHHILHVSGVRVKEHNKVLESSIIIIDYCLLLLLLLIIITIV